MIFKAKEGAIMANGANIPDPDFFRIFTSRIGIKDGAKGDDFTVIVSDRPASVAAVYTQSHFPGHSVPLSRAVTDTGQACGVVVVSKNANVANGPRGDEDARELLALTSTFANIPATEFGIASTGVIGRPYPMDTIRAFFASTLWPEGQSQTFEDAARAIMTTDTHEKISRAAVGDKSIVGIAKGVGMIEPNMATMLSFIFTDAKISPETLKAMFKRVVDKTFNSVSVDSDTSTSDTAIIFANGQTGDVDLDEFERALEGVCLDLTRQIAKDGEGATKLLKVTITGARDDAQAKRVAKAIVNSPLVKTAVHGEDPNWGRIIMAIGKCHEETDIDQHKVRASIGNAEIYPPDDSPEILEAAEAEMRGDEVHIKADLGIADGEWTVYGCDLSKEYVTINADYTT